MPRLHSCEALPGGYSLVVMELLAEDWVMLCDLFNQQPECSATDQQQCMQAVQQALRHAHAIQVQHGSCKAPAVHGDMRGPKIMVRRQSSSSSSSPQWDVKFVDLDWAGLEGVGRYPARMSSVLQWHPDAKPGGLLHRAHDVHMLEHHGTKP